MCSFFLSESKMMLFTFYSYFDLPLKQVQVDLPLKLLRELDVDALRGRFCSFYVCTKVFFFVVHKIALFAYLITHVDLPLLRLSWMVPDRTKKTVFCL